MTTICKNPVLTEPVGNGSTIKPIVNKPVNQISLGSEIIKILLSENYVDWENFKHGKKYNIGSLFSYISSITSLSQTSYGFVCLFASKTEHVQLEHISGNGTFISIRSNQIEYHRYKIKNLTIETIIDGNTTFRKIWNELSLGHNKLVGSIVSQLNKDDDTHKEFADRYILPKDVICESLYDIKDGAHVVIENSEFFRMSDGYDNIAACIEKNIVWIFICSDVKASIRYKTDFPESVVSSIYNKSRINDKYEEKFVHMRNNNTVLYTKHIKGVFNGTLTCTLDLTSKTKDTMLKKYEISLNTKNYPNEFVEMSNNFTSTKYFDTRDGPVKIMNMYRENGSIFRKHFINEHKHIREDYPLAGGKKVSDVNTTYVLYRSESFYPENGHTIGFLASYLMGEHYEACSLLMLKCPKNIDKSEFTFNLNWDSIPVYTCGGCLSTPKKIKVTEKNTRGAASNSKFIITYIIDKRGRMKSSRLIHKNKVTRFIGGIKYGGHYGFKVVQSSLGRTCLMTIFIPEEATIIHDTVRKKYRTNMINIVNIQYVSTFLNSIRKCQFCDSTSSVENYPCGHLTCVSCDGKSRVPTGKCLCGKIVTKFDKHKTQNGTKTLTHGYSFIYNRTEYIIGGRMRTTLNTDYTTSCGAGFHYQMTEKSAKEWVEYNQIPRELMVENKSETKNRLPIRSSDERKYPNEENNRPNTTQSNLPIRSTVRLRRQNIGTNTKQSINKTVPPRGYK